METTSYNSYFFGTGTDYDGVLYFKNGNVGVNKSSPLYPLDVNGDINASALRINGTSITANLTTGNLRTTTLSNTGNMYTTTLYSQNVTNANTVTSDLVGANILDTVDLYVSGNANTNYINTTGLYAADVSTTLLTVSNLTVNGSTTTSSITNNNPIKFSINGTTRMTLSNNGYVGIGTSTPAYMLDVPTGSIQGSNVNVIGQMNALNSNVTHTMGCISSTNAGAFVYGNLAVSQTVSANYVLLSDGMYTVNSNNSSNLITIIDANGYVPYSRVTQAPALPDTQAVVNQIVADLVAALDGNSNAIARIKSLNLYDRYISDTSNWRPPPP